MRRCNTGYMNGMYAVLDLNVQELVKKLEKIGLKKVYDDDRTIIAIDTSERILKKTRQI